MPVGSVNDAAAVGMATAVETGSGVLACSVASRLGVGLEADAGRLQAVTKISSPIKTRVCLVIFHLKQQDKTFYTLPALACIYAMKNFVAIIL